jgi:hypothetical protein
LPVCLLLVSIYRGSDERGNEANMNYGNLLFPKGNRKGILLISADFSYFSANRVLTTN